MSNKVYSFLNVSCIVGGTTITGFAQDSAIVIAYESPTVNIDAGADGETLSSVLANYIATVTLTLQQKSDSNAYLSAIANAYRTGTVVPVPLIIKDSTGADLHTAAHVFVNNQAQGAYSANGETRVWELKAPTLFSFMGGGQALG